MRCASDGTEYLQHQAIQRQLEVLRDDSGMSRVMPRLNGVRLGYVLYVFNGNVRRREAARKALVFLLQLADSILIQVKDVGAFYLVKYGIVRTVNLVPPVHVRREKPLCFAFAEHFDFVSRGVRPQHEVLVDIIAVRQ